MYPTIHNVFTLNQRYWLLLTALILSAITLLSLWPHASLPDVPGSDKTHHLIAYAALAFPATLRQPNRWLVCIALFILWGGAIELIQPYVNRYGEWLDFAANTAGVVLGLLAALAVRKWLFRINDGFPG